jgi:hypothetical protein
MSLEGKSVEDLQTELAKEEAALAAVGPVSSPNTEMKRPVVQHHEQRIIALKEAIASKGSSWYNPFSWGKKGGRRSRVRGGGWSMGSMIVPGSYEYAKYAGAGMDCAGSPVRPGLLTSVSGAGLPYRSSGGKRSRRSGKRSALRSARHHSARRLRSRKSRGGAAAALEYDNLMMRSTPGIPAGAHTANQVAHRGGRYEMTMGPLVAGSAIGMSGMGMAARIPCEQSTMNPLNQRGGAFPAVQVGAADMMRYEAPNAGYSNQMVPFPSGGAIPGMMTQVPYAAGSMNRACLTTGGKRSKRNKRSKRSRRK